MKAEVQAIELMDLEKFTFFQTQTLDIVKYRVLMGLNNSLIDRSPTAREMVSFISDQIMSGNILKQDAFFHFKYHHSGAFYMLDTVKLMIKRHEAIQSLMQSFNLRDWISYHYQCISGNGEYFMCDFIYNPEITWNPLDEHGENNEALR